MKITLCGSIAFYADMQETERALEQMGHEVRLPPAEVLNADGVMIPVSEFYRLRKQAGIEDRWIWERKAQAMRLHLEKVSWSEAIIVVNPSKDGIDGYIGANTFLEMGLAFYLQKPIYLLHTLPHVSYTEEIRGMNPILLEGNLAALPK